MGLAEALAAVSVEKKERGKGDKKYVSFSLKEWDEMEAKLGKKIDPGDVKRIVQGIFTGVLNVTAPKKA